MIPSPAGFRRHERRWTLPAKRSLRQWSLVWSSDRPAANQQVVG